jgi:hypothetical protein
MERYRKLELVQRSLGIRHKLKVHDSMKAPDTHEDLALMLLAKWELEDELHAIEEVLADIRQANVNARKALLLTKEKDQPGLVREPIKKKLVEKSERVSG